MALLPPTPVGVPPGHSYWNDWYEKLRQLINNSGILVPWTNLTGIPANVTNAQSTAEKNAVSGYAGLNSVSRITKGVDTTDDVIVDDATKGLVLKDTQGTPHYWRVTVSNLGALVITDLGTTKP